MNGWGSPYWRAALDKRTRDAVLLRDRWRCCRCGTWRNLTVDHIIALSWDGTDDPSNLQALCRSCNSSKSTWADVRVGCLHCGAVAIWDVAPNDDGAAWLSAQLAAPCSACGATDYAIIGRTAGPLPYAGGPLAGIYAAQARWLRDTGR